MQLSPSSTKIIETDVSNVIYLNSNNHSLKICILHFIQSSIDCTTHQAPLGEKNTKYDTPFAIFCKLFLFQRCEVCLGGERGIRSFNFSWLQFKKFILI